MSNPLGPVASRPVGERHAFPISLALTIAAIPRTKKTHSRIVMCGKFPRLLPSAQFDAWNRIAQMQLAQFRATCSAPLPLACPVNVRALFCRDRNVGDACNFYQAIADALQEGQLIKNDSQIRQWDGSRLLIDRENPRVEIWIQELAE